MPVDVSITANNGAEVQGQLLSMDGSTVDGAADGAVTLDNNTITNDVCLADEEVDPDAVEEDEEDPELPRTGGMTALMQLFGGLIAGAGALLYAKKK